MNTAYDATDSQLAYTTADPAEGVCGVADLIGLERDHLGIRTTLFETGHVGGNLPTDSLEYLKGLLTGYGSTLSDDHVLALQGLTWLASEMSEGRITGRYRYSLPCGMGKTSGVRSYLRTIAALGLDHSVTVACSKVEQLCRLKRELIKEDGVNPNLIGLAHSYEVDAVRARDGIQGYASEPSEGHDRQFLLVTHARVRVNDQGHARSWVSTRQDDLVFYDESLIVGQALTLPLLTDDGKSLLGDCASFETTLHLKEEHRPAVEWIKLAVKTFYDAAKLLTSDQVVVVTPPALTEEQAASHLRLRPLAAANYPRLASFIEQARDGVSFRVFLDRTSNRSLVSYTISVPAEIRNVIVLDASDPVREIVHHDYRMTRAEDVVPCLEKFRSIPGGLSSIKRYDKVTIHFASGKAGRRAMHAEFSQGAASALMKKFVKEVKEKPLAKWLALVFKQQDSDDISYSSALLKATEDAGIDPYEGLFDKPASAHDAPVGRVNVLTWGMETATNSYQLCDHIALLGVIHQRTEVMAGQYLGQVDNIRAPGVAGLVNRLVKAECLHSIYQAMNRGSMRRTVVTNGVSQAAPCEVYIRHSDPDLREKIEKVLPGATWIPWKEDGEDMSAAEVALLIANKLSWLDGKGYKNVTLRSLKSELAQHVPSQTFKRARDQALANTSWTVVGQRLVNLFA
jgi:hypothetical protein